jgi:hypothetical protein
MADRGRFGHDPASDAEFDAWQNASGVRGPKTSILKRFGHIEGKSTFCPAPPPEEELGRTSI